MAEGARRLMRVVLLPHPTTPCAAVDAITVTVSRHDDRTLRLRYAVEGDVSRLRIPTAARPARADDLWRRTCFEVFVRDEGESYREFNLSPSGEWAAYAFDSYRVGMRPADIVEPEFEVEIGASGLTLLAQLQPGAPVRGARIAISAVLEEQSGAISYWALTHPVGRPDFHHADSFTGVVP